MAPRLVEFGIPDLLPMKRSPGAHVSQVIHYLCIKLGHYEESGLDISDPEVMTQLQMGIAFEKAVIDALSARYAEHDPTRFTKTEEWEKDGLYGTPDLIEFPPPEYWPVPWDMKLTKLSSLQEPDGIKFWKYWVQLKAYMHMMGANVGRLAVCHINGDYRDHRGYTLNGWEDEFSDEELEENWRMLVSTAKEMGILP